MSWVRYLIADARYTEKIFIKNDFKKPNLILTSPPYHDIKNYGNSLKQVGYKQTYNDYLTEVAHILQQCYKVSERNATLWLIVDTIRKNGITFPLPFDINNFLKNFFKDETWHLKEIIIWNKNKNIPWHSKGRLKNKFEYILFFSKNEKYAYNIDKVRDIADYKKWWLTYPERYNSNGRAPSNIWEFTIPIRGWGNGYQQHLCPFPFPLIERILSISSAKGDIIFDPFAGSGSVLAIAKEMGRNAIGIDINSNYKKQFITEVLKGANKYWLKREKELIEIRKNVQKFRNINLKLRKIKAAFELLKKVNNQRYKRNFIILINSKSQPNKIDFNIVSLSNNGFAPNTKKLSEIIKAIESEYKIVISLQYWNRNHLIKNKRKLNKLFVYSTDKIFKYNKIYSWERLFSESDTSIKNQIISNIKINQNKYDFI